MTDEDQPKEKLVTEEGCEDSSESPSETELTKSGNEVDVESIQNAFQAFRKLPAEDRHDFAMFVRSERHFGPAESPIDKKFTSDHLTDIIRHRASDISGSRQERNFDRVLSGLAFLLIVGVAVFVLVSFKNNPTILGSAMGLLAGAAGGYGIGRARGQNSPPS